MATKNKKIITKDGFIEFEYKYDFELFLKLSASRLTREFKINIYGLQLYKPIRHVNKCNLSKVCDQILTKSFHYPSLRVNINPFVKERSWLRCKGLNVLPASLSVKHPDYLLPEYELFSRIACLQEFIPNFVIHESPYTLCFFWYLDRFLEITPDINANSIKIFWEKFRNKYDEKTDEYTFEIDWDLLRQVIIPYSIIPGFFVHKDICGPDFYIKLYGYDFDESKYYPIESVDSVDSEPKVFRTKPHSIEKFFTAAGCELLPGKVKRIFSK